MIASVPKAAEGALAIAAGVLRLLAATFALLTALAATSAAAQEALPEEAAPPTPHQIARARWQAEFDAFAETDRAQMPAPGGVLFVGSSSIRLWPRLAEDFSHLPIVINRGFGGSTMADCSALAHELVVRYRPRTVMVYAGDNDLAEGFTPRQVLENFASFVNTVRAELPHARIGYISVKPSPSRETLLPQVRETNHMIEAYLKRLPDSAYIDVYTPMLGSDGWPRRELFLPDMLHLNDQGYALWRAIVATHLLGEPSAQP